MHPIAALLAPQVARPFLMVRQFLLANVTNISNINGITRQLSPSSDRSSTPSLQNSYTGTSAFQDIDENRSKIYYIYIINACILFFLGFMSFILFCYGSHTPRTSQLEKIPKKVKPSVQKSVFDTGIWIVFFLTAFCLGSLEVSLEGLLFTFVVEYLSWTKSNAAFLLTVSALCQLFGRISGIPAATFLTSKIILFIDYILILSSLLCLIALLHVHPAVVWVCCCVYSLGAATVFATSLTWARDFLQVSGVFTSLFMVGHATGILAGPTLTGHFYKQVHPLWFCYMLTIFAGALSVLYAILLLFKCFIDKTSDQKDPKLKDIELKVMLNQAET